MKKTVALHNLGCKVNAYEMEAMEQMLQKPVMRLFRLLREQMYILSTPVQ